MGRYSLLSSSVTMGFFVPLYGIVIGGTKMYTLKEIVSSSTKPVYVHLSDHETARRFLEDAENQGFVFSDGAKPTEKHTSNFFAAHSDMTINYIGIVGRMAYQCKANSIIHFDYAAKMAE